MQDQPSPLLDSLDVAVVVQDREYRITYANRRATEMLGISTSEMVSRTTHDERWDVVTSDGKPVADDGHPGVRALRTGQPVRGVILGVKRGSDTERSWIIASAIPEFDADGTVRQVVITFSDVSEVQRAVRESEATYQAVFSSMSEGLVIHAPDGSIRAANAAAERALGLTIDQMSGRAATDPRWRLIKPDGSPVDSDYIPSEIARRTGEPVSERIIGVHRPTGELAWLSVRADPLREAEDPALRGVLATFADVTNERETRLALQRSEAQSRRVLDAIPGVIYQYLHPAEGADRFVYLAGRIVELMGLDADAARADPGMILDLLAPEERGALAGQIAAAVASGGVFEAEVPFMHPSLGARWVRIRGVPERTPEGLLYTGVILDVTEQRQLAERLRRTQRREAMAQMAAGVAHNFNNMLAAILPNLELARETASEEQRILLEDAERAALSAADLVRRMLAVGRPEAAASAGTVDLVPILREVLHICRQTFDRSIAITDDIEVRAAPVRGAASDLEQVVLNLCLNARDALEGRERRTLSVSLAAAGDTQVRLTVTDSGCGMDDATLRRIGEPFFSTKEPGRGTGLGLASAFNTITEAGGSWTVASARDSGTTFTVLLPTVDEVVAERRRAPRTALGAPTGTILLVDDEAMVRDAISRLLTRAGYRVVPAKDAAEALAALGALERAGAGAGELRAILLDLSMPGLSGEALLPRLKAIRPGVPVVVLSGHVDDRLALDDAAAVLQKPVGSREVLEVLARVTQPTGPSTP